MTGSGNEKGAPVRCGLQRQIGIKFDHALRCATVLQAASGIECQRQPVQLAVIRVADLGFPPTGQKPHGMAIKTQNLAQGPVAAGQGHCAPVLQQMQMRPALMRVAEKHLPALQQPVFTKQRVMQQGRAGLHEEGLHLSLSAMQVGLQLHPQQRRRLAPARPRQQVQRIILPAQLLQKELIAVIRIQHPEGAALRLR